MEQATQISVKQYTTKDFKLKDKVIINLGKPGTGAASFWVDGIISNIHPNRITVQRKNPFGNEPLEEQIANKLLTSEYIVKEEDAEMYADGGSIGKREYTEAEKWWGNDLSLNEQKEYAKKHLENFEYSELMGSTSQFSTASRRKKFITEIWEKEGRPKSIIPGIYANGGEVNEYDYMMLSRLQSDADYYLGYGNRNEKVLWALNVDDHIKEMKNRWNALPEDKKPEWLTMEDILEYEQKMKNPTKSKFSYYKVPNEELYAIQECNPEYKDGFGSECIVIRTKKTEEAAIAEVERLNKLGYSDYAKGGELPQQKDIELLQKGLENPLIPQNVKTKIEAKIKELQSEIDKQQQEAKKAAEKPNLKDLELRLKAMKKMPPKTPDLKLRIKGLEKMIAKAKKETPKMEEGAEIEKTYEAVRMADDSLLISDGEKVWKWDFTGFRSHFRSMEDFNRFKKVLTYEPILATSFEDAYEKAKKYYDISAIEIPTKESGIERFKTALGIYIAERYQEEVDWDRSLISYEKSNNNKQIQRAEVTTLQGNEYTVYPTDLVDRFKNGGEIKKEDIEILGIPRNKISEKEWKSILSMAKHQQGAIFILKDEKGLDVEPQIEYEWYVKDRFKNGGSIPVNIALQKTAGQPYEIIKNDIPRTEAQKFIEEYKQSGKPYHNIMIDDLPFEDGGEIDENIGKIVYLIKENLPYELTKTQEEEWTGIGNEVEITHKMPNGLYGGILKETGRDLPFQLFPTDWIEAGYIYTIFEGYDHYNQKPLFQVVGKNNDYVGEWHDDRKDAEEELEDLIHQMKKGGETWIQDSVDKMEKKGTVGTFTNKAARHGLTPIEYAKKVLANPDKHTEKTRRQAQFVKNTNPEKFN
ncbi:MAG: hypothetical protein PHT69_02220 [Bacteroidales bacterium]|nr:hypothetical protein [Bacteroidales bacterium]